MIRELPESEGAVLGFEVVGKISLEQELEWIARFDEAIEQYAKVSALIVLGEQASWGLKAGLEDLKWIFWHMKQLDRIAVVSHGSVWKWLVALDSPFAKLAGISERHFEPSRVDEAWAWVRG